MTPTLPQRLRYPARASVAFGAALLACPAPAFAHAPSGWALAESWTWNPWLLAGLLFCCGLYVRGYRALSRRLGGSWARGRRQAICFAASIACLVLALLSPLDLLSDEVFSAHMVQHELLMLVAAPLLVWARPLELYLWGLPDAARTRVLRVLRRPTVARGLRWFTAPAVALAAHAFARWIWHVPVLFEWALADERVHGVQHAMFFVTALQFWWAVMQGRYGRAGYGVSVVFVFATLLHTGALGALITLSTRPWYATYAQRAHAMAIDALRDQQLAGLLMWVACGVLLTLVGVFLAAAWLLGVERRNRHTSLARLMRRAAADAGAEPRP
jgi:putative membrane protein